MKTMNEYIEGAYPCQECDLIWKYFAIHILKKRTTLTLFYISYIKLTN